MSNQTTWTDNIGGIFNANATTPLPVASGGTVASGTADSGNPIKIGVVGNDSAITTQANGSRIDVSGNRQGMPYVAVSSFDGTSGLDGRALYGFGSRISALGDTPTPVGVGDYVYNGTSWDRQRGDLNGIIIQSGLSSTFWNYAGATGGIVNTTTAVTIKTAAGAAVRNFLKTLQIDHDLLGAATEIAIRDGAAGTVLWRGKLQTSATEARAPILFDPPLKGTANTLMEVVTLTATVSGGVFVNATGFTGS